MSKIISLFIIGAVLAFAGQAQAAYPFLDHEPRGDLDEVIADSKAVGKRQELATLVSRRYSRDFSFREAVRFLEEKNLEAVSCSSVMNGKQFPTETYKASGEPTGYHRRTCYDGEMLLVDVATGEIVMSLTCGNAIPVVRRSLVEAPEPKPSSQGQPGQRAEWPAPQPRACAKTQSRRVVQESALGGVVNSFHTYVGSSSTNRVYANQQTTVCR